MKSKRGGAIVEAVMVFPVMMLSIIAVLWLLVYFYDQLDRRTDMHMMLRAQAGEICGNYYYVNYKRDGEFYTDADGIYSYAVVSMDSAVPFKSLGKQIRADKYLIDETKIIRLTDSFTGGKPDDQ